MATGAALITELSVRLRDQASTVADDTDVSVLAHSRVILLDIINRVNYALNAFLRLKVGTATLALTSQTTMYSVAGLASDIIRVIGVRADERDLTEVPWDFLVHQDPSWFRRVGARPELFARIGRDILVIYPAMPFLGPPPSVQIRYVQRPATIADSGSTVTFPTDDVKSILLDLAEVVALYRGRVFAPEDVIKSPLERFMKAIAVEGAIFPERHVES